MLPTAPIALARATTVGREVVSHGSHALPPSSAAQRDEPPDAGVSWSGP